MRGGCEDKKINGIGMAVGVNRVSEVLTSMKRRIK